jgi:hypothetical protein
MGGKPLWFKFGLHAGSSVVVSRLRVMELVLLLLILLVIV